MIFKKLKAVWILIEFIITVSFVLGIMKIFRKYNWPIRRVWAKMQRFLLGVDLEVIGKPDLEAKLLIINHQSLLDIVILDGDYPKNIAWVAKKEIADIFFFGHILKIPRMIIIDRESKTSLIKLFKDSKDRVENGRVVAIFPEGTRGSGDDIQKFKVGAKLLAQKLGLKVQPVVLIGTRKLLDSQNFTATRGKVKLIYLDSIDPKDDKDWYKNIRILMQKTLDKELSLTKD
ncbi:MAG TPA: 1-acyl-sn-glycerol-3-phosphate acyltransferase [Campylobacterales bacterium]|nr:1-acyl-sn-glycerol-3-phosphate acyltransferase [Campylobacterales bacterium]